MDTVYVETTIPSYLTAYPSRDIIICAHQQITIDWWANARKHYNLYISEAVIEEVKQGDVDAANKRLDAISDIPILAFNEDIRNLVHLYEKKLGLPKKARTDLIHISFAVAYEIDYIATWNCSHLANCVINRKLQKLNDELNRFTPLIATPEEL